MSAKKHIPDSAQLPLFDPITIKLTKGLEATIDPIDADLATFKWYAAGADHNNYAKREINGKNISLHRIIMARMLGRELTPDEKVDHRDGNRFNNCRDNLRLATQAENCRNTPPHKDSASGYKGVGAHNGKWQAMITINGKRTYLGLFNTPQEAHEAYRKAAQEHYGEFARFE